MKRKTTVEFVSMAKKIHGGKYDYTKVQYKKTNTKIEIICPIHGSFFQTPNKHLNKHGCPKCGGKVKLTLEKFIERAVNIHKNRYKYDKFVYINANTPGIITCQLHGDFLQTPSKHLNHRGCWVCCGKKIEKNDTVTNRRTIKLKTEEVIERCNKIHNNFYNYSKTKYINSNTKIEIICPIHGSFWQLPNNHFQKKGCEKCGRKKITKFTTSAAEKEFLNYINIPHHNRGVKIGKYIADGFDEKSNTIYEFLGDYWHGNPKKYNTNDINKSCDKTFGELYIKTFNRFRILHNLGYTIKYIWEKNWIEYKIGYTIKPKILVF